MKKNLATECSGFTDGFVKAQRVRNSLCKEAFARISAGRIRVCLGLVTMCVVVADAAVPFSLVA